MFQFQKDGKKDEAEFEAKEFGFSDLGLKLLSEEQYTNWTCRKIYQLSLHCLLQMPTCEKDDFTTCYISKKAKRDSI